MKTSISRIAFAVVAGVLVLTGSGCPGSKSADLDGGGSLDALPTSGCLSPALLFNRWNSASCTTLTNTSTFSLASAAQDVSIALWVNTTVAVADLQYTLTVTGVTGATLSSGVLDKEDCDVYQSSWCKMVAHGAQIAAAGSYSITISAQASCANADSANVGFVQVSGCAASNQLDAGTPTGKPDAGVAAGDAIGGAGDIAIDVGRDTGRDTGGAAGDVGGAAQNTGHWQYVETQYYHPSVVGADNAQIPIPAIPYDVTFYTERNAYSVVMTGREGNVTATKYNSDGVLWISDNFTWSAPQATLIPGQSIDYNVNATHIASEGTVPRYFDVGVGFDYEGVPPGVTTGYGEDYWKNAGNNATSTLLKIPPHQTGHDKIRLMVLIFATPGGGAYSYVYQWVAASI